MPTMSDASTPSRKPMTRVGITLHTPPDDRRVPVRLS
jgi:hypothetical protein